MKKDKALAVVDTKSDLSKTVNNLFSLKTPKEFIKKRPGAGGMVFDYVEVGYVVTKLNEAFGVYWEWKITDKQIGDGQVWVQGSLTVKSPNGFSVTKDAYGGSDIKKTRDGKILDIANDLKAASSDALKKAASLFGIAADIYFKEMEKYEAMLGGGGEVDVEDTSEAETKMAMQKLFAVATDRGFTKEDLDSLLKPHFKVESLNELTKVQIDGTIIKLEREFQVVEKGEKPLKIGEVREVQVPLTMKEEEEVFTVTKCYNCQKEFDPEDKSRPEGLKKYYCSTKCQDEYYAPKTSEGKVINNRNFKFKK